MKNDHDALGECDISVVHLTDRFVILSFHLQGGLERITKYMMSALIVLMLVLAVHSFTLPGAGEGLSFYLIPHFPKSPVLWWWAP